MAGLFYEEFKTGQIFDHPIRYKLLMETDNVLFTDDDNTIQLDYILDEEYMKMSLLMGLEL